MKQRLEEQGAGATVTTVAPARIVVALDCSGSMDARDYRPSRLDAGKEATQRFIDLTAEFAPQSEVGVVAFNSVGQTVLPVVRVRDAREQWPAVSCGLQPGNGTDLEAGLRQARRLLGGAREGRRIILLTDGHGGDPTQLAAKLKRKGVLIDVVGIGGSPDAVAEGVLRQVASVVHGDVRYRFIRDAASLFAHFRKLAVDLRKE